MRQKECSFSLDLGLLDPTSPGNRNRRYHSAETPVGVRLEGETFEQKQSQESYDSFYQRGGWTYDEDVEAAFLWHRIILPLNIKPGSTVLELGCGSGTHSYLLSQLGMNVTGVDLSPAAIETARRRGGAKFACSDAKSFLANTDEVFDVVFVRAMSWFHYELEPGLNKLGVDVWNEMGEIMNHLHISGLFVLQIRTDFSGTVDPTGIRNHSIKQALTFFESFGSVELLTDWSGDALSSTGADVPRKYGLLGAIKKYK